MVSSMTITCSGRGNCSRSSCSKAFETRSWGQMTDFLDRNLNSDDFVISLATSCLNSLILNLNNTENLVIIASN